MMTGESNQKNDYEYVYLPEGIHKIVILTATEKALAEVFIRLDQIFAQQPHGEALRLLSDIRQSGIPPVTSLWSHARQLLARHPNPPVTYNAIVHGYGKAFQLFSVSVAQLARLYNAKAQFFSTDHEAVDWLMKITE